MASQIVKKKFVQRSFSEVGHHNNMYYTYLLMLSNHNYYVGSTKDLKNRLVKHQSGAVLHTSKFRPVKLTWSGIFVSKKLAIDFEKYLKSSSGKAFRNKHLI